MKQIALLLVLVLLSVGCGSIQRKRSQERLFNFERKLEDLTMGSSSGRVKDLVTRTTSCSVFFVDQFAAEAFNREGYVPMTGTLRCRLENKIFAFTFLDDRLTEVVVDGHKRLPDHNSVLP